MAGDAPQVCGGFPIHNEVDSEAISLRPLSRYDTIRCRNYVWSAL